MMKDLSIIISYRNSSSPIGGGASKTCLNNNSRDFALGLKISPCCFTANYEEVL